MEIDPQKREEAMSNGCFQAFIPRRLSVEGLPEYSYFPMNVMYLNYCRRVNDDQLMTGQAIYEPEFHTHTTEGSCHRMRYRNIYGEGCYLYISFDEEKEEYIGEKFVNGESVMITYGKNVWQMFFIHLTMGGLAKGEKCFYEEVEEKIKKEK